MLMPTGKLLLWSVLLETMHGEGLALKAGARCMVPSGWWQGRWPSKAADPACLPKAGDTQPAGPRKHLFKAGLALPSATGRAHPSAVPLSGRVALCWPHPSARLEASNAVRQGWGLGEPLGGAVCATVMDDANRDDIPEIFIPFHTSGKLFSRSSCKVPYHSNSELLRRDPERGPQ